jgi:hypothetical protein
MAAIASRPSCRVVGGLEHPITDAAIPETSSDRAVDIKTSRNALTIDDGRLD